MVTKRKTPALAAVPTSKLLQIPDALAEAAEAEINQDEAPDGMALISISAEQDDALEDTDILTFVVDPELDAVVGILESLLLTFILGEDAKNGWLVHESWQLAYDMLSWVLLLAENPYCMRQCCLPRPELNMSGLGRMQGSRRC
jgi:hypothetical protein